MRILLSYDVRKKRRQKDEMLINYHFHKLKINEMILMKYEFLILNSWNDGKDIYWESLYT